MKWWNCFGETPLHVVNICKYLPHKKLEPMKPWNCLFQTPLHFVTRVATCHVQWPLPFHGFQWSLIVEHIHIHSRVSWCTLDIPYKKGWRQAFPKNIHCLNIAKIPLTKRGAYQRIEKDVDVPYKKGRIQKHEFATHSNGILANNLTTFQTFPYITQMFSMWCPLQACTLP